MVKFILVNYSVVYYIKFEMERNEKRKKERLKEEIEVKKKTEEIIILVTGKNQTNTENIFSDTSQQVKLFVFCMLHFITFTTFNRHYIRSYHPSSNYWVCQKKY